MLNKFRKISLSNWLVAITSFYIAGSILQNILAAKAFGSAEFAITEAGTMISWLVFACMDIITEIWGKKRAIQTFIASAIGNLCFSCLALIAIAMPRYK